jgi:hypothetical protein
VLPDITHGSVSGYKYHGCRCTLCRAASIRYEKGRRWLIHQGIAPTLPARGFNRRVHALMAIGWTQKEIAAELGIAQGNLALKLRTNGFVRRATHEAMVDVYDRLCMTRRDSMVARRTAGIAARNGWSPPLAWDDIDTDVRPLSETYRPRSKHDHRAGHEYDEVVVLRILSGDFATPSTHAEKREVVARWTGSQGELARLTGWKVERYTTTREAA